MKIDQFIKEVSSLDEQYIKRHQDEPSIDIINGLKNIELNYMKQYSLLNPEYKLYLINLNDNYYDLRNKLIDETDQDKIMELIDNNDFYIKDNYAKYYLKKNLKDNNLNKYIDILNDNETINEDKIYDKDVLKKLGSEINHLEDNIKDLNNRLDYIKELYDILNRNQGE